MKCVALTLAGVLAFSFGAGAYAKADPSQSGAAPSTPAASGAVAAPAVAAQPAASQAAVRTGGADPQPGADADSDAPSAAPAVAAQPAVLTGSPFASPAHRQRADQARSGQTLFTTIYSEAAAGLPAGTIGVLIHDVQRQGFTNLPVKLEVTHESIAEGNNTTTQTQITDAQGRAGFLGLATDSSYRYQVSAEYQGGVYSSGPIQLRRDNGQVVALNLFPASQEINDALVFSRGLYVVQPRDDVFEIQVLLRFHNASAITWVARDFPLPLPPDAKAFKPNQMTGDIKVRFEGGRALISGTFSPGQQECSFNFHLPNERYPSAQFRFPLPPHAVDVRVYTEASRTTTMTVAGFESSQETRGKDGQRALLASKDFLRTEGSPDQLDVMLAGLPTRGYASWVGAGIAFCLALLGVSFAVTGPQMTRADDSDRRRARDLLIEELVTLDKARKADQIGPKTYEQTRRTLLDAVARLTD